MILGEFDSIKGFFEHYCFLKRPSDIHTDHKLLLFRENKKPLWEVIFLNLKELLKWWNMDYFIEKKR